MYIFLYLYKLLLSTLQTNSWCFESIEELYSTCVAYKQGVLSKEGQKKLLYKTPKAALQNTRGAKKVCFKPHWVNGQDGCDIG